MIVGYFEEKTAVSAGNAQPPRKAEFAATLQVAQVPPGFVANHQRASWPQPEAPPPSAVLAMGLRDSVNPGHMNATIAMALPPQGLPPPPAPTQQPSYAQPTRHSSSYGPPPPQPVKASATANNDAAPK